MPNSVIFILSSFQDRVSNYIFYIMQKSSPPQRTHFKFTAQRDFNHLWHSALKAFQIFIQSSITESTQQIVI